MTATKMRPASAGGLTFEVLEAGAGGRPLLLVHGFTGAKEDFRDWVAPLAERGWHVVAPDLRGHGGSDHPVGPAAYSFAAFVDDLLGLTDELGWARFVLLGHSMGGMVAQCLTLSHPERVAALVLMDTSHAPIEGRDEHLLEFLEETLSGGGMEAWLALGEGAVLPPATARLLDQPGQKEFSEAKTRASSPDMAVAMLREMFTHHDRLESLGGVRVPTLVLVGEQDEPFLGPSRRMAGAIPGAELAVIADAAHQPQLEAPEAWWKALTTFLDRLPPT